MNLDDRFRLGAVLGLTARIVGQRVEAAPFPNPASRAAPVVTLSIGVATLPPDRAPKSVDDLQREADAALYAAKRGAAIGPGYALTAVQPMKRKFEFKPSP